MQTIHRVTRAALGYVLVAAAAVAVFAVAEPGASALTMTIKSFTPTGGPYGTQVTITGTNLNTSSARVFFGGVSTVPISQTSTTIVADVPACALSGPIKVTEGDFSATSSKRFTISHSVSVSPAALPPGQSTTVCGSAFTKELIDVYFDGTDLAVTPANTAGNFQIPVTVPASATPGNHWITAVGRHDGSYAQTQLTIRTNWVQDGDGPSLDRSNTYENVLNTSSVANLGLAWSFPAAATATSGPVVADGTVYTTSANGFLLAVNETNGRQEWAFPLGTAATGTPVVANGVVYVGDEFDDVYAVNAATGAQIWSYVPNFGDVAGGITYANGELFILDVFNAGATAQAFNAATGTLRWSAPFPYPNYRCDGSATPAVAGGLFIVPCDGVLTALRTSDGSIAWQDQNAAVAKDPSPAIMNGIVYVTDSNSVGAYRLSDGSSVWVDHMSNTGLEVPGGIAAHGGSVYVGTLDNKFYSLNALNGAIQWSFAAGDAANAAAWADGVVYFGTQSTGDLYALDATTGANLWAYPAGQAGPVVVTDGQLLAGANGSVDAFNLAAGQSPGAARPDVKSLRPNPRL